MKKMKKGIFKNNLFTKFFLLFLICILVPMLFNLFYTTYSSSNTLEEEARSSLSKIAFEKKQQVDLVFKHQFDISEGVVNELYMVNFFKEISKTGEIDRLMLNQIAQNLEQRHNRSKGLYENIFSTYEDKVMVDGIGGASVGYLMDEKLESYYYDQLKNPGVTTGNYMYSPMSGRPTLPIVNSIIDDSTKQVLSVFVIAVDVNKLTEQLVNTNKNGDLNTNIMILDPQGLVIASDKSDLALNLNFSEQDEVKGFFGNMSKNVSGSGKFTLDGIENIAFYVKDEKYGFYILSYMPVNQYMEKVDALKAGIIKVIVLSVALSGFAVFFVVNRLVKPIKIVANKAQQIAAGDLTSNPINIKSHDEIGELAKSFNAMFSSLKEIVAQIGSSSEKVAASAEELFATSEQSSLVSKQVAEAIHQVAVGAEGQSRFASDSSAMIKEITNGIRQVSQNTQNVAASSAQTSEKANIGAKTIYSSISEIGMMNKNIHHVADKIKHLGESSKEIGKIVGVITQIADQTNLLALNAAIEAARAGEHGRGFAVVAEEVRKLAEQSKKSSVQIKDLVDAILGGTEQTVLSVDETVKQSSKGIEAIKYVEETFHDIQSSIAGVTGQIQEVAAATIQIDAAISQIELNTQQITMISTETASKTQEVAASMEEHLASSEEISVSSNSMAKLATELQELVRKFRIDRL